MTQEMTVTAERDLERFMPVMNIAQAVSRRGMIVEATQKLMRVDVDYGKIPGTDRDVLLQPGADKLCNLFGLVVRYEFVEKSEDWTGEEHGGEPFFYYKIRGIAYRGDYPMGEGVGSCNSWESKYRWRKTERVCPQCGKAAIIKGKGQFGGGWFCWAKKEGCGAKFKAGDAAIESQEVGRIPNPDIADVVNTVLKMAYKRCKVSTTINATSASEFFSQDAEDFQAASDPTGSAAPAQAERGAEYPEEIRPAVTKILDASPGKAVSCTTEALRVLKEGMTRKDPEMGSAQYMNITEEWNKKMRGKTKTKEQLVGIVLEVYRAYLEMPTVADVPATDSYAATDLDVPF